MTTITSPSEVKELQEQIQHLTAALQEEQVARERAEAEMRVLANANSTARLKLAALYQKLEPSEIKRRVGDVIGALERAK